MVRKTFLRTTDFIVIVRVIPSFNELRERSAKLYASVWSPTRAFKFIHNLCDSSFKHFALERKSVLPTRVKAPLCTAEGALHVMP